MTTPPPPQGQNPYAQAPTAPAEQQPGQPGGPQQPYAPFPQQQGGPVPPPAAPAKRGGKKLLRILGVIVVAVIIGVIKFGIGWWASETDAETTSVGACMHNDGSDSNADLNEVDCSSSEAQYKVVQKFDNTSDDSKCEAVKDAEIAYYQSGNNHDVVLCLKQTK
ncbi:LppU/SCO3897 family protein [Streptomyces sp. NPDC003697]